MTKLLDGNFKAIDMGVPLVKIENDTLIYVDERLDETRKLLIEYGEFGTTTKELTEKIGEQMCNLKIISKHNDFTFELFGVISSDGKSATIDGSSGVFMLEWVTEKEAEIIAEEAKVGDPIEAPPGPYKIQPENQGKLLWISGSPGMGKSTSAQLLGRKKGFVYYEGDCFMGLKNPYIPLTVKNPTLAQKLQKNLSGHGLQERKETSKEAGKAFMKVFEGWEFNFDESEEAENIRKFFKLFCEDISREKKRIGGDWAVASAMALNKEWRQYIRSLMGPDLVIVNLTMSEEATRSRISKRHGENQSITEMLMKVSLLCMSADDEEGVVNILIDEKMNEDDVIELILKKTQEYYEK